MSSKPERRGLRAVNTGNRTSPSSAVESQPCLSLLLSPSSNARLCSFMDLFSRYSLSNYCVPGAVPGPGEPSRGKRDRVLPRHGIRSPLSARHRSVRRGAQCRKTTMAMILTIAHGSYPIEIDVSYSEMLGSEVPCSVCFEEFLSKRDV